MHQKTTTRTFDVEVQGSERMPSAKMKRMEASLARCGQEEDQDPLAAGRYGSREILSLKMDSSRSYSVEDCRRKRRKKSRLDVEAK